MREKREAKAFLFFVCPSHESFPAKALKGFSKNGIDSKRHRHFTKMKPSSDQFAYLKNPFSS
jgi:hypothetical protein